LELDKERALKLIAIIRNVGATIREAEPLFNLAGPPGDPVELKLDSKELCAFQPAIDRDVPRQNAHMVAIGLAKFFFSQVVCLRFSPDFVDRAPLDELQASVAETFDSPYLWNQYGRAREGCPRLANAPYLLARIQRENDAALKAIGGKNPSVAPNGSLSSASERDDYLFRQAGAVFEVAFEGETGKIPVALNGVRYIHHLLEKPHKSIKASELRGAVQVSENAKAERCENEESLRKIRERLIELEEELRTAKDYNDASNQVRLEEEKEKLLSEVKRAVGKGGHARLQRPDRKDVESVRRAVKVILTNCGTKWRLPKLADHLARTIEVGTEVVYRPDSPAPKWNL
jgi:hypothetical protein